MGDSCHCHPGRNASCQTGASTDSVPRPQSGPRATTANAQPAQPPPGPRTTQEVTPQGNFLCKSSTRSRLSPVRHRYRLLRRPLSGCHADSLRHTVHASPRSQSKPRPRPELGTLTRNPTCSWSPPAVSARGAPSACSSCGPLQHLRPLQLPGGLLWSLCSRARLQTLAAHPTAAAPVAAGLAGSALAPTASAWPSRERPRLKPLRATPAVRSVLAWGHRRRPIRSLSSRGC